MRSLVLEPFYKSQMFSQTIVMSNLDEALITLGFEASEMFLNFLSCFLTGARRKR